VPSGSVTGSVTDSSAASEFDEFDEFLASIDFGAKGWR